MTTPTIDSEWFTSRLEERDISQRGLAKLMGIDPAAISLMFRGKRRITLEDAAQLAVLLNVSTTELLSRAGMPIHGERQIKIIGTLSSTYDVIMAGEGAHESITAPPSIDHACVALQARTTATDQEQIDGYLYFISSDKRSPATCIGLQVMTAIKGDAIKLCHIKRGYRPGTFNLLTARGDTIQSAELAWASPVLWIKTTA